MLDRLVFLGRLQQAGNLVFVWKFLSQFGKKLNAFRVVLLRPQAAGPLNFLRQPQSLLALRFFGAHLLLKRLRVSVAGVTFQNFGEQFLCLLKNSLSEALFRSFDPFRTLTRAFQFLLDLL